jgi:hypothetical protein
VSADDPAPGVDACTAVLLSVPQQMAERIRSFLNANDIPCRIRRNTEMTPERLAAEYLEQAPGAAQVLDIPLLGPLLRGRLSNDLKAEIEVVASDLPPVWDVLVRPGDLPDPGGEPLTTAGASPKLNVPPPDPVTEQSGASTEGGSPDAPVVLTELPWAEAFALAEHLTAEGIPAAVMAAEAHDRERHMGARIVPVGVRPADLERAKTLLPP